MSEAEQKMLSSLKFSYWYNSFKLESFQATERRNQLNLEKMLNYTKICVQARLIFFNKGVQLDKGVQKRISGSESVISMIIAQSGCFQK